MLKGHCRYVLDGERRELQSIRADLEELNYPSPAHALK